MARTISRAEAWERTHQAFTQVNFNSFDYNSIKESLLDYVKLYYPEDFNDYIESSEFIAILELFAYVGELLAYRLDVNAHENFITTAQRKESILRLAKLISYKVSRNIPARGLVKITSIQTTENIIDSYGRNLAGKRIFWNDTNNINWKEQFLLVMNRILEQEFGSVDPSERIQVDDVLFELYSINNNPFSSKPVLGYSATTGSGVDLPMELVPIRLTSNGPVERRPEFRAKFSLVYASDGLGDSSDTTGFMMYTKQGTLSYQTVSFDGVTPNQTFTIETDNINDTDVWINNVDINTNEILITNPADNHLQHLIDEDLRYGEWIEVDLANSQNIIFNTYKNRHKYELETLDRDRVRVIFGDGEFSDIPAGVFHIWYRTSANDENTHIERSAITNKPTSFTYTDENGSVQTVTVTFSLINSLQNASKSEDIEHIRRVAPSVYYTQDRMVNGRDYNMYMLRDSSILRLRSINRTFAGDSKYIAWHDPKEYYENVKLFGDDLALYWLYRSPDQGQFQIIDSAISPESLLQNVIEPLLSTTDIFADIGAQLQAMGTNPGKIRRTFNGPSIPYITQSPYGTCEREAILTAINLAISANPIVNLWYSAKYDEWFVGGIDQSNHPCEYATTSDTTCPYGAIEATWMIKIEAKFQGSILSGWEVRWINKRLIAHSQDTKFWHTNYTNRVINFDTLNSQTDKIVVLGANKSAEGYTLLSSNHEFSVVGIELLDPITPNEGLVDVTKLSILPADENNDGIPDRILLPVLFDAEYTYTWGTTPSWQSIDPSGLQTLDIQTAFGKTFNISSEKGLDLDVIVYVNGIKWTFSNSDITYTTNDILDSEQTIGTKLAFIQQIQDGDVINLKFNSFVYFHRDTTTSAWIPQPETNTIKTAYVTEAVSDSAALYKREYGRYPLNFAWFHSSPRLNLIDPAVTNIIDTYIITTGYYIAVKNWISGLTSIIPSEPTPQELRVSYAKMIENKMISDTMILHPGKFKILFGSKADPQLRCKFKVVRPVITSLTDNQIKVRIVDIIKRYFDVDVWDFGETFYYTEMSATIHAELGSEIDSIVIVPTYAQNQFGDLFQIQAREDEIFMPDVSTNDIEIIQSFTPDIIRQNI